MYYVKHRAVATKKETELKWCPSLELMSTLWRRFPSGEFTDQFTNCASF